MPHSFVSLILLDEINIKVAKVSLKEKTEGALSIFQRSKNAILEAADAVRRATGRSQIEDDMKRTKALAASSNQMIWTGYANCRILTYGCSNFVSPK